MHHIHPGLEANEPTTKLAHRSMLDHVSGVMSCRRFILCWLLLGLFTTGGSAADISGLEKLADGPAPTKVVVIPVQDQIAEPLLYIVRRGLKQAIDNDVQLVVLDMKTPGGAVNVTLDIMEALDKFAGRTVTFVNDEAISAGALIASVTDDIYFAPKGVMGAAEVVFGTGQDVGDSMKRKLNSYMRAKIEAFSSGQPNRADIIRAMMDPDFELKIGEELIKPKGELLSLTAGEAAREYGEPPLPLLATGVVADVAALLKQHLDGGLFIITRLEITWSEKVAQYLTKLAPLLLAAGLVLLFIEFKTPGFGVFGISGGLLLAIVFFGHYIAGFSGHEPILLFGLGLLLIALEIFIFPGVIFLAGTGGMLLLVALVWSMADLWPNEPITFSGEIFLGPITSVGMGLLLAVVMMIVLLRFLPRNWIWDRLVLQASIGGTSQAVETAAPLTASATDPLIGKHGVAVTALFPGGQVEINGVRYEAHLELGMAERGTPVVVTGRGEFGLRVEPAKP
jgi:membrane-bound serine protease (ClpP class)